MRAAVLVLGAHANFRQRAVAGYGLHVTAHALDAKQFSCGD